MFIEPPHKLPGSSIRMYNAYIFSGSSNGAHTAPDEIVKLTYIEFMFSLYAPYYIHKSFCTHVLPQAYDIDFVVSIIC